MWLDKVLFFFNLRPVEHQAKYLKMVINKVCVLINIHYKQTKNITIGDSHAIYLCCLRRLMAYLLTLKLLKSYNKWLIGISRYRETFTLPWFHKNLHLYPKMSF